ncbi:MAG: hypothetical protein QGD89_08055 [Actinomycetota bacterium]|nr:hypothetical protein [Actinomycetota bacterium]
MSSPPTTTAALRFCIVNGCPLASRENFDRSDVGHPHELFRDFLSREAPNATSDIVYVADPEFALPPGAASLMLAGRPPVFDGFLMHLDEETRVPEGTVSLAGNVHTPIQAAVFESGSASYWATPVSPRVQLA